MQTSSFVAEVKSEVMFRRRGWTTSSTRSDNRCVAEKNNTDDQKVNDTKIRYFEDDPEATEAAVRRRPRRHTTGGPQNAEVIQKARQVVANGDPSGQYGTLDRKQLVSILKQRYGSDLDKYGGPRGDPRGDGRARGGPGSSKQGNAHEQEVPVEDRYPLGQQRLVDNGFHPNQRGPVVRDTEHQYHKIAQLHNQGRSNQPVTTLSSTKPHYKTKTTTTTTTVVRRASDGSQSSLDGNFTMPIQTLSQSPRMASRAQAQASLGQQYTQRQKSASFQGSSSMVNGRRASEESVNSDGSFDHQWGRPTAERMLFLQYKDEVKRVMMPSSISSIDTLKALFVTAFPGKVSMVKLDETGKIYIKDKDAGIFYELDDLREVRPKSHLQIHERASSIESGETNTKSQASHATENTLVEQPRLHWADDPNYPGASLVRRPHPNKYAESLQEFPMNTAGIERAGSGSSLKSDTILTRPLGTSPQTKQYETRTTYRNQNWGVFEDKIEREYAKPPEMTQNGNAAPPSPKLGWHAVKESTPKSKPVTNGSTPTVSLKVSSAVSTSVPRSSPKKIPPPVKPRDKAREDARRKLSAELSASPTSPTTVEEQLADLTELLHTALISDEEDGGRDDGVEEKRPEEKPPEKPPLPTRQSSKNAVANVLAGTGSLSRSPPKAPKPKPLSAKISLSPTSPSSITKPIDIVGCAITMKSQVLTLRSQLDELRALQGNSVKQFKSFIGHAKNELNSLLDQVNNNAPDTVRETHGKKSQREQLQGEEDLYHKKMEETEKKLELLEESTEAIRKDVVQRKVLVHPENLETMGQDLQDLSVALAELRSRFSSLHDVLKVIMSGELEIIVQEEKFLKEEPSKLDSMLSRCKHLSGTIFTLQKLASVQQMSRTETQTTMTIQVAGAQSSGGGSASDTDGDSEKSVETKQARVVRFKDQDF